MPVALDVSDPADTITEVAVLCSLVPEDTDFWLAEAARVSDDCTSMDCELAGIEAVVAGSWLVTELIRPITDGLTTVDSTSV